MTTMKAAIYTGIRQIELQDVERKAPAPGHLTIQTRCSGIFGSDLHNYFGEWEPSKDLAAGHELCGSVAEVGEAVTDFKPGGRLTDLIASGRIEATKIVTHRFPFANVVPAFQTAADKTSGAVKVHLVLDA